MVWYAVMCGALALLLATRWRVYRQIGLSSLWEPKLRLWCVMVASSLATYLHQSPQFYLAICLFSAWAVLDHPKSLWQTFIAWIYLAMAGLNVGLMLAGTYGLQNNLSVGGYSSSVWVMQVALGWVMVAAYLVWIGHDPLRRAWIFGHLRDNRAADSAELDA